MLLWWRWWCFESVVKCCSLRTTRYLSCMSVCEIRMGQEGSDPSKSVRDPCKVVICRDPGWAWVCPSPIKTFSLLSAWAIGIWYEHDWQQFILMKIKHHYDLQTKLTPRINKIIIELAVTYFKRVLMTALKHVTTYNKINVVQAEAKRSGVRPESRPPVHGCCRTWKLVCDPPKCTSLFRTPMYVIFQLHFSLWIRDAAWLSTHTVRITV